MLYALRSSHTAWRSRHHPTRFRPPSRLNRVATMRHRPSKEQTSVHRELKSPDTACKLVACFDDRLARDDFFPNGKAIHMVPEAIMRFSRDRSAGGHRDDNALWLCLPFRSRGCRRFGNRFRHRLPPENRPDHLA